MSPLSSKPLPASARPRRFPCLAYGRAPIASASAVSSHPSLCPLPSSSTASTPVREGTEPGKRDIRDDRVNPPRRAKSLAGKFHPEIPLPRRNKQTTLSHPGRVKIPGPREMPDRVSVEQAPTRSGQHECKNLGGKNT